MAKPSLTELAPAYLYGFDSNNTHEINLTWREVYPPSLRAREGDDSSSNQAENSAIDDETLTQHDEDEGLVKKKKKPKHSRLVDFSYGQHVEIKQRMTREERMQSVGQYSISEDDVLETVRKSEVTSAQYDKVRHVYQRQVSMLRLQYSDMVRSFLQGGFQEKM